MENSLIWARPCPGCNKPIDDLEDHEKCGYRLERYPAEWGGGWYWVELEKAVMEFEEQEKRLDALIQGIMDDLKKASEQYKKLLG